MLGVTQPCMMDECCWSNTGEGLFGSGFPSVRFLSRDCALSEASGQFIGLGHWSRPFGRISLRRG